VATVMYIKPRLQLTLPLLNDVCNVVAGFTTWDGTTDITATTGNEIEIIEVDGTFRAIKAGKIVVVSLA